MTRYKDFDALIALTKLTKSERGYSKFIQTGQLGLYDYGVGFIDLEVYVREQPDGCYAVRLWFGTIDDGDFGGWRQAKSHEQAEKLVKDIVNNVFKDMVAFPTVEELNKQLQRYGVAVGPE